MLPITSYREQITSAVLNHYVTIITAETGAGKSSQVPQYLAHYFDQVLVTQPRIMAAKTLATRVAQEMNVTLGQEVGYRTGYDTLACPDSKIVYATDGLQVVKTLFDQNSQKQNVLIIDEVHEWNLNIETLIAWVKFMKEKWNTKVVLMSTTLETASLSKFFEDDVCTLNVSGTLFDIKMEERSAEAFIPTIFEAVTANKNSLVFVSGKQEIANTIKNLQSCDAVIFPLHSEMDWQAQQKCFASYSKPKVIVATNIAQTSVTIPDIDVVIDTGKAKAKFAHNGIEELREYHVSISDIMQRKGRAGRTKDGEYYLCSNTSMSHRPSFFTPEIQRSILDRVVLQLASIHLDAEKLDFYHQPKREAILAAKNELCTLGALDSNNQVTEIGLKMIKMPVSVQISRMIVEAEKYGVTEQVVQIAAILEIGGLLEKDGSYSAFTDESSSDLLAELDIWNKLNEMKYIDFECLKIKKKNFFKIKEHLCKLQTALCGIVKMTHENNRSAILKSCLSGYLSKVFMQQFDGKFVNPSTYSTDWLLSKNSCVGAYSTTFLVATPIQIATKNRYGIPLTLNLLTFASKLSEETLEEFFPNCIEEKSTFEYSACYDAVRVTKTKYFLGWQFSSSNHIAYHHPAYADLKAEYEASHKDSYSYFEHQSAHRQTIEIDGKIFNVIQEIFNPKPFVYLDEKTLFTTNVKDAFLEDGTRVWFSSYSISNEYATIPELRDVLERKRIHGIFERKKREYASVKSISLSKVLSNKDMLGTIELTMDNGGYGSTPVLAYGCISLKKKNVIALELCIDEEMAQTKTAEALQLLFGKEIEQRYGNNKFNHQSGKKKKFLSSAEKEMKEDFYSFVREVMQTLTIENVQENLDFLEEYYQELMEK